MRSKTGVIWLDNAVEEADRAGFPDIRDRDDCCLIYSRLIGQPVAPETYRRLPIPTIVLHGRAKQNLRDVENRAKKVIAEATPHTPAPSRRRGKIA
jgi:hypothetical protein